jgi:hypothetical protein
VDKLSDIASDRLFFVSIGNHLETRNKSWPCLPQARRYIGKIMTVQCGQIIGQCLSEIGFFVMKIGEMGD